MKTYIDFLNESVSVYNELRTSPKSKLNSTIESEQNLSYHHVRGILDNPHAGSVDAIKRLTTRSGSIDSKGVGLLAMHAMNDKDDYSRNQHAYHLVNSGSLNDTQLKHVAKHALKNSQNGMFDDHLAKKIKNAASNKEDVGAYVDAQKGV